MSITDDQIEFALELFSGIGALTYRKMMGGLSIYSDGVIFAMIHGDERIFLKAAGAFIETLETAGWERWSYTRKNGKKTFMPYWALPDAILDDADEACIWARKALASL